MKFTPAGKITIANEINIKNNRVIVRVKDTGTGISSDILPKLFTKFVSRSTKVQDLGCTFARDNRGTQWQNMG